MGVTEEVGKVGAASVEAMKSTPLALALLLVNAAFIGFMAFILSIVGNAAVERNKQQMELIEKLIDQVRDCRAPRPMSLQWPPVLR